MGKRVPEQAPTVEGSPGGGGRAGRALTMPGYDARMVAQADNGARILVSLERQTLTLQMPGARDREYPVSTASAGPGEEEGSGCTPRGPHQVRAKIGAGQPLGTVFQARRPTGEVYTADLGRAFPDRDWILTRILWLSGLEPGRNRLGRVDSMRRFIYIHGTPDSEPMGEPRSHGCIRMTNQDVADLFDRVAVGTRVDIE